MYLPRLEVDRLRNLKAVQLDLSGGLTMIVGRNGQGKTSLLESIFLLATGRSFRTRRQDELIGWDGGPLRVAGRVESRRGVDALTVVIDGSQRSLLVNGQESELVDLIGRLDVVDLTGSRMDVLRGAPEERRRFLDRGIVGLRPFYLKSIGEYRRVLQQRNALLRRGNVAGAELDVWNDRLKSAATVLHTERRTYSMQLASRLGGIARTLFQHAELRLRYRPSPAAARDGELSEFKSILADALNRSRQRDLTIGHTCIGPHRDELVVELDGTDLRKFGSAGQLRAAMVALKLAKLELLREDREESPLFLMDDFDTDLDERRAAALAAFLEQGEFQTLVATSKETLASRLGVSFATIRMDDGQVRSA